MTRWRAAGIHLGISAILGLIVLLWLYFIWYPAPYFQMSGGSALIVILLAVDVIIGPLLTLIVFKSGKPSLRFDLSVIALLQLGALAYGLYVMAIVRPAYVVMRVDRVMVVPANQFDPLDLGMAKYPEFKHLPWFGPKLVTAPIPTDPAELEEATLTGFAGKDLELRPKFYVPFEQGVAQVNYRFKLLSELRPDKPEVAAKVQQWLTANNRQADDVRWLPLQLQSGAGSRAWTVLLDAKTSRPIGALDVDPW